MNDITIGSNPLPFHIQEKLAQLVGCIDEMYDTRNGPTALYWMLSYQIAAEITNGKS